MGPRREQAQIILIASGLLTWALLAVTGAWELARHGQLGAPWVIAQGLFGAGFYLNTQRPFVLGQITRQRVALLVQLAAALYIARVGTGFSDLLLVIMAGQVPFSSALAERHPQYAIAVSSLFVVAQTAAVAVLFTLSGRPPAALLGLARTFGLELFAMGAATLAIREFRARHELFRLHSELLATRSLFAESLRHAERNRIARSLHDEIGHQLTALSLQLEVASHDPGQSAAALGKAQNLTRELLASVRNVVGALRGAEPLVVEPALRLLSNGIPYPRIHLEVPPGLTVEQPAQADALFHCVQEALTNAVRHAGAENVWVQLVEGSEGLEVRVRDDGRGVGSLAPGHGLRGMRERLEEVGGRLEVAHALDHGFEVRAWVPMTARTS